MLNHILCGRRLVKHYFEWLGVGGGVYVALFLLVGVGGGGWSVILGGWAWVGKDFGWVRLGEGGRG